MSGPVPEAIYLMGPTATGKTDLAVRLLEHLPCEIISVDSVLIYRGMDIGTAKPSPELLARAPHRLVDIRDPAERYSAGDFRRDALAAMGEIRAAGNIPLLVGGTMLYFHVLEQGLATLPSASAEIRAALDRRAGEVGWPALHAELARVDPLAANRIHPNDPQRIQRALEVYQLTGKPISELQAEKPDTGAGERVLRFSLADPERSRLHARIEARFLEMIESGFVEEVQGLRARGDLHRELPSMRAVGYRQIWDHLDGQYGREEAIHRGIVATRRLAKRQLTWLRRRTGLVWLDPTDSGILDRLLGELRGEKG